MTQAQVSQIAQVVALVLAQMQPQAQAHTRQPKAAKPAKQAKPAYQPKAERKAGFAAAVVAAFKAKGLVVTPNVDVFTFKKWADLGLQPKEGEKATFVKTNGMNGRGIPLFHKGQVEALRNPV